MDDPKWTPKMVAVYLEDAAGTLRRLPPVRAQGFVTAWPPIVRNYWEAIGWDETEVRLGPPSAKAIDQMDRTLLWLRWLERDDQRIVWDRANHRVWKAIAHERHIDRSTAWRRWTYAMVTVAVRLNAQDVASCCNTFPCNTPPAIW
jgi:Domain of unknown function (DUF6362)